jgi:hypothetical protein
MALRRSKSDDDSQESQNGLMTAIESFATDLPSSGEPVVVRKGETFAADHELVKQLPIWFCPSGTSSWEREAILQRRLSKLGHPGR